MDTRDSKRTWFFFNVLIVCLGYSSIYVSLLMWYLLKDPSLILWWVAKVDKFLHATLETWVLTVFTSLNYSIYFSSFHFWAVKFLAHISLHMQGSLDILLKDSLFIIICAALHMIQEKNALAFSCQYSTPTVNIGTLYVQEVVGRN